MDNQTRVEIKLLKEHRGGVNSTSFTGRPEGKEVRRQLKLDECDGSNQLYVVTIPSDATSFNPSFLQNLLLSIKSYLFPIKIIEKSSFLNNILLSHSLIELNDYCLDIVIC